MKRNLVLAALAAVAFLASEASARGGDGGGGRGGMGGGGARGGGMGAGMRSGGMGGGTSRGSSLGGGGGRSFSSPSRSTGNSPRSAPGGGSSFRGGSGGAPSRAGGFAPRTTTRGGGAPSFRPGGDSSRGQRVSPRGQAPRGTTRSGLPTTDSFRRGTRSGSYDGRTASRTPSRTGFVRSSEGRSRGSFLKDGGAADDAARRGPSRTGFSPRDTGGTDTRGPRDGRGNGNQDDNGPGSGQGAGHDDGVRRGPGGRSGGDGGAGGGGANGGGPRDGRGNGNQDDNGPGSGQGAGHDDGVRRGPGDRSRAVRDDWTGRNGGDQPGFRRPERPTTGAPIDRKTYRDGWRNGHRVGNRTERDPYHHGRGDFSGDGRDGGSHGGNVRHGTHHNGTDHHGNTQHGRKSGCDTYDGWYDNSHWYLSFSFGTGCGPYVGFNYYYPYHSWNYGCDYAFFYPQPVSWCYTPFGFYWGYEPSYVTRYEVVRETVPVYVYEPRETVAVEQASAEGAAAGPAGAPGEEVKVAEPKPAAGSPATEKHLREGSEMFHDAKYYEAAVKFRLAALSSPDLPGPYFALGQSLVALGHDEYAARVLRKAVLLDPKLLDETGDVTGVFKNQEEYDRVLAELETRAAAAPADGDARFLLAFERYFTGDARCRDDFRAYCAARPGDAAASLLKTAVEVRFKAADELPPIK